MDTPNQACQYEGTANEFSTSRPLSIKQVFYSQSLMAFICQRNILPRNYMIYQRKNMMGVEADENNQVENPQIKVFFVERSFDFLNFDYFDREVNVQYESVLEHLLNVQ